MKTIARDENCDLFIDDNGNIAIVEGKDAFAQIINAKMRTSLGELQLDAGNGLPYFQTIFKSRDLYSIWEAEVIKMLESLTFVKNIKSFSCFFDGDLVKYTAEIETDEGELTING